MWTLLSAISPRSPTSYRLLLYIVDHVKVGNVCYTNHIRMQTMETPIRTMRF